MRIREILEARGGAKLRTSSEDPFSIAVTKRFVKDWREFARSFPEFVEDFNNFLNDKAANIDEPSGKKDTQWGGGQVDGLSGWWHAHMRYGKAVVIYRPVGRRLVLAAVTDHLSVEGVGHRIKALGEYLDTVSLKPDVPLKSPMKPITVADRSEFDQASDASVDANADKPASPADAEKRDRKEDQATSKVTELLYSMAANSVDRVILDDYLTGSNNDLFFFMEVYDIDPSVVQHDELILLINKALQDIPLAGD